MSRRAIVGLGLAGCGRTKKELRLLTFPESYGHHLSLGLGFYREQGLEVSADYQQSFPRMIEALLAGNGDVATVNYDAILVPAAEGRDVVAFLCLARRPGAVLAAPGSIQRMEDLKGKTIGIPGPGSSSHMMLDAILRAHGMTAADYQTAAIGVAAGAIAALEHRKVDAAMLTNLGWSMGRRRVPSLRILADLRTEEGARRYLGSAVYPSLCLAARRPWLAANRNLARRFAYAFRHANQWMAIHGAAEIRAALPEEARAQDAAADIEAIEGMQPTLDTEGKLEQRKVQAVLAVVRQAVPRIREAKIDLSSTVINLLP